MTIESELLSIKGKKELLTAQEVVGWAAKHPKSKLYRQFEWDDTKAAEEYRLWQARRIIAVHIVYADGERKFVSLSIDRSNAGGGYRNVDDVLQNKTLHEIMLGDALRDLDRIRQHYEVLKQLKPVWTVVDRIRRRRKGEDEKRAEAG